MRTIELNTSPGVSVATNGLRHWKFLIRDLLAFSEKECVSFELVGKNSFDDADEFVIDSAWFGPPGRPDAEISIRDCTFKYLFIRIGTWSTVNSGKPDSSGFRITVHGAELDWEDILEVVRILIDFGDLAKVASAYDRGQAFIRRIGPVLDNAEQVHTMYTTETGQDLGGASVIDEQEHGQEKQPVSGANPKTNSETKKRRVFRVILRDGTAERVYADCVEWPDGAKDVQIIEFYNEYKLPCEYDKERLQTHSKFVIAYPMDVVRSWEVLFEEE